MPFISSLIAWKAKVVQNGMICQVLVLALHSRREWKRVCLSHFFPLLVLLLSQRPSRLPLHERELLWHWQGHWGAPLQDIIFQKRTGKDRNYMNNLNHSSFYVFSMLDKYGYYLNFKNYSKRHIAINSLCKTVCLVLKIMIESGFRVQILILPVAK